MGVENDLLVRGLGYVLYLVQSNTTHTSLVEICLPPPPKDDDRSICVLDFPFAMPKIC